MKQIEAQFTHVQRVVYGLLRAIHPQTRISGYHDEYTDYFAVEFRYGRGAYVKVYACGGLVDKDGELWSTEEWGYAAGVARTLARKIPTRVHGSNNTQNPTAKKKRPGSGMNPTPGR
jgi:hypothetical protein